MTEYSAVTSLRKLRAPNPTRFADTLAQRGWDIAAMAALLAWICALVCIQRLHTSFVSTSAIIHYFPAAQKVLEGQGYRAFDADIYRGPGYPLALAAATLLAGGDMFTAGKVIGVTSSTMFLLLAYLLLRRVFDPVTAFAAMLLTMGVNTFVWVSCANGPDVPFACLAMASMYFTARHGRPSRRDATIAGLLAGLALTVRWAGLFLPLFILVWMALVPQYELSPRSRIQIILAHLLGFLVASSPWLYLNYLLHGSPLYAKVIVMDPSILPPSESLLNSLLQALKQQPLGYGLRFMAKLLGSFPTVTQGLNNYPQAGGWVMAGSFWVPVLIGLLFLLIRIDRLKLWFLLISSVWWASLVPMLYQARFYILLIPTFSALSVFFLTSGALPDARLSLGKARWAKVTPGYILDRLIGSRLPGWLSMTTSGASLASLILIALLAATVFSTVKHIEGGYRWYSERNGFYHELARFVRQLPEQSLNRPIGARQWSQARYWIPSESGTPVAPLPGQDYESVLPDLSYVLYDQMNDQDTLIEWWDDPQLSVLADPLLAPATLEAVYYKPDPPRAILYRILERSNQAEIVSARASSALPQNPAAQAFDNDAQTWWSSAPHSSEDASESITFDLGRITSINRVWLLPRPGGQASPSGLLIEASQDGSMWQPGAEPEELPEPIRQNPQIFSFPKTTARFVRITATRLRWDDNEAEYLTSLAEVRIGLAVERATEPPVLHISSTDMFFDPLSNELVAGVHNQGRGPGRATIEFSEGRSVQDAEYLGTVKSSIAEPGEVGFARLWSTRWHALEPGYCLPIWAIVKPLGLDTYGMVAGRTQPQTAYNLVCSPREAIIDDFDYLESPLARGWTVPADQTATGNVITTYAQDLGRRVMRVTSAARDGFMIFREMTVHDRPVLTLRVKSTSDFIIYVHVIDLDGEYYYVQYMPFTWAASPQEFPQGRYIYRPLGVYLVDGDWHRLERDVYEDFLAETGREADHIGRLSIRAYDSLEIAEIGLEVRK